ncbi:hypothetical protein Asch01_02172 [Acinetobacter schindleri]
MKFYLWLKRAKKILAFFYYGINVDIHNERGLIKKKHPRFYPLMKAKGSARNRKMHVCSWHTSSESETGAVKNVSQMLGEKTYIEALHRRFKNIYHLGMAGFTWIGQHAGIFLCIFRHDGQVSFFYIQFRQPRWNTN